MPTMTTKELTVLKIAKRYHRTIKSRLAIVNMPPSMESKEPPAGLVWIGRRSERGGAAGRPPPSPGWFRAIPLSEHAGFRHRPSR
jgi:hypothetical protein